MGSTNLGSKGSFEFVAVMAGYPAIFCTVDLLDMEAEGPDQHGGGLGRVEEGQNGLNN